MPSELFELGSPTWGLPRPRRGVGVEERDGRKFVRFQEILSRCSAIFNGFHMVFISFQDVSTRIRESLGLPGAETQGHEAAGAVGAAGAGA